MADIHIDDFYRDCALSFLRLYAMFPRKGILYVDDITGPDDPDEFGLHSERFQAGFSTLSWLAANGYIDYDEAIKQEALDQAVLSHKAFMILSSRSELDFGEDQAEDSLPASVMEHSRSNISQLRKALKSGSSIMVRQCVHYLLDQ